MDELNGKRTFSISYISMNKLMNQYWLVNYLLLHKCVTHGITWVVLFMWGYFYINKAIAKWGGDISCQCYGRRYKLLIVGTNACESLSTKT